MCVPMKKIEFSVTCFHSYALWLFKEIFLSFFYIWVHIEIDYDLIACDVFIFRPKETSSGHSLMKRKCGLMKGVNGLG